MPCHKWNIMNKKKALRINAGFKCVSLRETFQGQEADLLILFLFFNYFF